MYEHFLTQDALVAMDILPSLRRIRSAFGASFAVEFQVGTRRRGNPEYQWMLYKNPSYEYLRQLVQVDKSSFATKLSWVP